MKPPEVIRFKKRRRFRFVLIFFLISGYTCTAIAQNRTFAEDVASPYSTIHNLAVEWYIEGDDNQNGRVTVQFREKGSDDLREGHSFSLPQAAALSIAHGAQPPAARTL